MIPVALVLVSLLASTAQSQTGDWHAVENLQTGTLISVRAKHRVKCTFVAATADMVTCQLITGGLLGTVSKAAIKMIFDRQNVREVRLQHSDGSNTAVGAVVGAGVGAVFGAVGRNTDLNRGASTVVGAGFGALLGGFLGLVLPLRHGRIIYRK